MAVDGSKKKEKLNKPAAAGVRSRGPKVRQLMREKKKKFKEEKEAIASERISKRKELDKINKNITKIQNQLNEDQNDESKRKLEEEVKYLQFNAAEVEGNLAELESKIEKIQADEMDLDTEEADSREAETGGTGEEEEESGNERWQDNETTSYENAEPVQEGINVNSAEKTASPAPPDPGSSNQGNKILGNASSTVFNTSTSRKESTEDILDRDTPRDTTELFASQAGVLGHPQASEPYPQDDRMPEDFDDFSAPSVAEQNQNGTSFSLDNGKVILHARSHKLSLISYGPKYSAMLIWSKSGASAAEKLANVTNLLGSPHNQAMERDEQTDTLKYKGRIGPIKAIAWLPRKGSDTMPGILNSVEELNPKWKKQPEKYVYPFSCVLVELEGCWDAIRERNQSVWIDRSKYKALCSSGKDSSARTDRKFYEMGCLQVKRFREWAGKQLDITWNGDSRVGYERSPTPLEETPEPDYGRSSQALADQSNSNEIQPSSIRITGSQSIQSQNPAGPNTQNQATPSQATPSQATPSQTTPSQVTQSQNAPNQASERIAGQQKATTDGSSEGIKSFYEIYLMKNDIDPEKPWKELDDKFFPRFVAAAKIYIKSLKDEGVDVRDDMELGRAFQNMRT